ncbi:hypothetical protein D9M68_780270 [compost metagenome]
MVPGNPVLGAQPLDKLEIAFAILRAVFTLGAGANMEGVNVGLNPMTAEHLGDDLRHGQVLKNALVVAELQVMQDRHQAQLVTGQTPPRLAHTHIFDTAVNPLAIQAELEKGGLTE